MDVTTADALAVRERPVGSTACHEPTDGVNDTSVSASDGTVWVGVERSPPGWFRRRVTVLEPSLDLPRELVETLRTRREDLQRRGLCKSGAHNAAWQELSVDERYRDRLGTEATSGALERIESFERPVVVATTRQPGVRCHRAVLADWLDDADDVDDTDDTDAVVEA